MEKIEKNETKGKKKYVFGVIVGLIIASLAFLLIIASYFRDFGKIKLSTNSKNIFTIEDLKINDLKFKSTEKEVKASLGEPKDTKEEVDGIYKYKKLTYSGLTVTLKEYYDDFILSKIEVTSKKYTTSRGIKVGNKITKALKNYKIENKEGAYLYGNYTKDVLKDSENKENVYFGVRSSENILYVNRDAVIDGTPTNIAKLDIVYKNGVIKKITWSYDIN